MKHYKIVAYCWQTPLLLSPEFSQEVVPEEDAVPGAVIAIHSFGDFLGWHPHIHVLRKDGCFYGNGMLRVAPLFELKHLEEIFRHKVFMMLLK